jgi:hypothetical protein
MTSEHQPSQYFAREPAIAVDLDVSAHLYHLAERITSIADDLPLAEQVHSGRHSSEDITGRIAEITGVLTYLGRESDRRRPGRQTLRTPAQRHLDSALARAATPLGQAVAALAAAITQTGTLHDIAARTRASSRDAGLQSARQVLNAHIATADQYLRAVSRQLVADADHFTFQAAQSARTQDPPTPLPAASSFRDHPPEPPPPPPSGHRR